MPFVKHPHNRGETSTRFIDSDIFKDGKLLSSNRRRCFDVPTASLVTLGSFLRASEAPSITPRLCGEAKLEDAGAKLSWVVLVRVQFIIWLVYQTFARQFALLLGHALDYWVQGLVVGSFPPIKVHPSRTKRDMRFRQDNMDEVFFDEALHISTYRHYLQQILGREELE